MTQKKNFFMFFFIIGLLLFSFSSNNNNAVELKDMEGNEYLAFAQEMPAPVGGLPSIYKKIEYPKIAKQAGVEGKVYVLAFVDEQGNVNDVKVVKGIGAGCDEVACDAVQDTKFKPGKHKGKNVKVKLSLAITFKLK